MCTVVALVRPSRVLLAANRDERIDRPWDPPAEYWPGIFGGRDRTAGGTWMAMNRAGVVATVLNRPGELGPAAGKRSRGELPLLALAHDTAEAAAEAIAALDAGEWRGFNMVIADASGGFFLRGVSNVGGVSNVVVGPSSAVVGWYSVVVGEGRPSTTCGAGAQTSVNRRPEPVLGLACRQAVSRPRRWKVRAVQF